MTYKSIIIAITAALSVCSTMAAQNNTAVDDKLFATPTVPEQLQNLTERCDYLVTHYWDRCNFKTAFSSLTRLSKAFEEYLTPIPYATADTVHSSVNRLIANVKKSPDHTLQLAKIAERWLYCDSATFRSEEVYLPFAKAVVANKKINSAERARFEHQVKLIESSGLGFRVPDLALSTPEGLKYNLGDIHSTHTLIFINDPDCTDCSLTRVRLSADINANKLIAAGKLTIVSIYPDAPDSQWIEASASFPANWVVTAFEDADSYFDIRTTPQFYFLDESHKVIAKDFTIDNLLRTTALLANE